MKEDLPELEFTMSDVLGYIGWNTGYQRALASKAKIKLIFGRKKNSRSQLGYSKSGFEKLLKAGGLVKVIGKDGKEFLVNEQRLKEVKNE